MSTSLCSALVTSVVGMAITGVVWLRPATNRTRNAPDPLELDGEDCPWVGRRQAGQVGLGPAVQLDVADDGAGRVAELGIGARRDDDRRRREGLPDSGCSADRRPRQTLGRGRHSDRRPGPAAGRRWAPSSGSAGRAVDIRSWRRRCKWLRRTEPVLQRRGRRWPAPGAASGSWLGGDVVLSGHAEEPGRHRSATAGMTSWPITSSGPFFHRSLTLPWATSMPSDAKLRNSAMV